MTMMNEIANIQSSWTMNAPPPLQSTEKKYPTLLQFPHYPGGHSGVSWPILEWCLPGVTWHIGTPPLTPLSNWCCGLIHWLSHSGVTISWAATMHQASLGRSKKFDSRYSYQVGYDFIILVTNIICNLWPDLNYNLLHYGLGNLKKLELWVQHWPIKLLFHDANKIVTDRTEDFP